MKEIISTDLDKIVYKENDKVYVYERSSGSTLTISSYKNGEVCITNKDGKKSYSTGWDNHLDWFPKEEQEKVNHARFSFDKYIYDGGNGPVRFDDDYWDTWSKNFEAKMNKVEEQVEQAVKNIDLANNSIISNSNNNYIVANGKHYKKPTGSCSVSIVNNNVKINGKRVKSIEEIEKEQELQSDLDKLNSLDLDFPDNSRFPADASIRDPIYEEKEIILFDAVTYHGHKLPKCKGMICNSSGEVTNIVETKDMLYCNGHEFVNGNWEKTFRAKLKTLFK